MGVRLLSCACRQEAEGGDELRRIVEAGDYCGVQVPGFGDVPGCIQARKQREIHAHIWYLGAEG